MIQVKLLIRLNTLHWPMKVHTNEPRLVGIQLLDPSYLLQKGVTLRPSHPCFRFAGEQTQWLSIASC